MFTWFVYRRSCLNGDTIHTTPTRNQPLIPLMARSGSCIAVVHVLLPPTKTPICPTKSFFSWGLFDCSALRLMGQESTVLYAISIQLRSPSFVPKNDTRFLVLLIFHRALILTDFHCPVVYFFNLTEWSEIL